MATSKYWITTPFIHRCVYYLPTTEQDPVANGNHIKKEDKSLFGRRYDLYTSEEEVIASSPGINGSHKKGSKVLKKQRHRNSTYDASDESDTELVKNRQSSRLSRSSPIMKMEEIVLTDSEDEPDFSLIDHPIAEGVTASSRLRAYRRVVKPQPFEMDGRQHLKSFLESYEHYFEREYAGTTRECTQELRRYLKGELRDTYDILGRELPFPDIKYELLRWYKGGKVGGKQYWREQLKEAKPKAGESLHL